MAILATQKVLTLDYWKIASDLRPGDIIFDKYGNRTTIKVVQPFRAQNCYRAWFNDGLSVAGDKNLKLPLETEHYRTVARRYKGVRPFCNKPKITSFEDLLEMSLAGRDGRHEYSIPTAGPLNFPHQTLPVPPFVFGYWFFNRRSDGMMTIHPANRDFVFEKFKDSGYKIVEKKISHGEIRLFTTIPTVFSHLAPLIPTKIPNNYLLASIEQRIELLQGIVHFKNRTYNQRTKTFRISHKSEAVLNQIQYLAESIGCKTKKQKIKQINVKTVFIWTRLPLSEKHQPKENKIRQNWRYLLEVVEIPAQGCVHIETDSPDTGFLVGEGFIACH